MKIKQPNHQDWTLKSFFKKYDLKIKNLKHFNQALTHSTFTNENRTEKDYQRLEFLGDTILSFLVSHHIFNKFHNLDEGKMSLIRSSLVSSENLANISLSINLDKLIRVGKSLKNVEQNQKILADIFESLIAALYLDQGMDVVKEFLTKVMLDKIPKIKNKELKNPKTLLQEHLQSSSRKTIEYKTVKSNQGFLSKILYDNLKLGKGSGKTKQLAEVAAAKDALNKLK